LFFGEIALFITCDAIKDIDDEKDCKEWDSVVDFLG
jgi:hypothetical protein